MARKFHRHRGSHPIADLNVTNLIDLGFMLLVIFMVATPLIQQEQTIPVKLPPESKSTQQKPDSKSRFHAVSIDAAGRFYLDNDKTPLSLATLKSRLRAYAADKEKPVIRIRGDDAVPYGKVIQVMDELKKLDLMSVTFDTQAAP
ncbi:MAG: biopolymer transporter ExbD [Opitutaceae bacterium]|nr:biopolymer transporter ExbD [Opitutaceae bacterium]